ncbi:unnamed protein product [Hermetia illucens]|uniref:Vezatin n=1 Tax=Hermetia illucens TaxID=343691 RepID=A0A7R8UQV0_HERIL|nr:uncharacterized protein LOC119652248 [Hermetia illucens]CAD7085299.1 unnamed protein product [Hermetia illucens]
MNNKLLFNADSVAETTCSQNITQYDLDNELTQRKHFVRAVLRQILNSRRLLIDHVECLENILFEVELRISKFEFFTLANASLVGSLAILLNVAESVIRPIRFCAALVGSSFGALYFYKCVMKVQNVQIQNRIEELIQCIRSFGNGVKKNISYFNELLFMRSGKVTIEDIHYKRAWGCIQAIKTVTETLFFATRHLEESFPLSSYLNDVYSPIEDLNTCHYFTRQLMEFSPQHIKDFYNIFAYIQSQFLLRLALSTTDSSSFEYLEKDLPKLVKQIKKVLMEEEKNFLKIASTLKQRRAEERSKLHRTIQNNQTAPTSVLKDISLKLTSSIVAVAEECEKLDNSLQHIVDEGGGDDESLSNLDKKAKLLDMADSIRAVELSLSTCNDDFQRLMLIYNKYVLNRMASSHDDKDSKELVEYDADDDYEHLKALSLSDVDVATTRGDDYFAYSYDDQEDEFDNEKKNYEKYSDYELYNLDHNVTKKRFKPVLKQLIDKIDPIREDTMKNERKILESKGIDVNKFYGEDFAGGDRIRHQDEQGDSDESDEVEKRERPIRTDQYSELREFLARKGPVKLFSLPQPPAGVCEEEIIE